MRGFGSMFTRGLAAAFAGGYPNRRRRKRVGEPRSARPPKDPPYPKPTKWDIIQAGRNYGVAISAEQVRREAAERAARATPKPSVTELNYARRFISRASAAEIHAIEAAVNERRSELLDHA
jgi:hypothetical protein